MSLFLRSFCFDMFYRVFVCRSVAELVDFNEVCDIFFFFSVDMCTSCPSCFFYHVHIVYLLEEVKKALQSTSAS